MRLAASRLGGGWLRANRPEHRVIRAVPGRRAAGVPPYRRMAGIILSSPDVAQVFDFGGELARRSEPLKRIGAEVWGPAPAPIARVRGRLLVKAGKEGAVAGGAGGVAGAGQGAGGSVVGGGC